MQVKPNDLRYIPLTQQEYCCVPTCMQMVMYKHGIPLVPAEELGYHLGLVVPPEKARLFIKVRTSETPPASGYGTQIYLPEYEPNKAFKKLGIPLSFSMKPITEIKTAEQLLEELETAESKDKDVLLCFNHGALIDDPSRDWGHLCVFDRMVDGQIRIIDPSPNQPKWRLVSAEKMLEAMKIHGKRKTAAGLWYLENLKHVKA